MNDIENFCLYIREYYSLKRDKCNHDTCSTKNSDTDRYSHQILCVLSAVLMVCNSFYVRKYITISRLHEKYSTAFQILVGWEMVSISVGIGSVAMRFSRYSSGYVSVLIKPYRSVWTWNLLPFRKHIRFHPSKRNQ